jgi:hypothetical protein
MALEQALLQRTILSKYLLLHAQDTLAASSTFAPGMAILSLHDATEILLRTVAESRSASIKEQSSWEQLVTAVERAIAPTTLPQRSSLNQLNKARVGFKHFALEPRLEDARKLLANMEDFIPWAIEALLGEEYARLSLRTLIAHRRTENWILRGEEAIEAGQWDAAIAAVATALAIYRSHLGHHESHRRLAISDSRLREQLEGELNSIQAQLSLLMDGVHLPAYRRFDALAPYVSLTAAGTVHQGGASDRPPRTRDDALFCLKFVTEAVLAMKRNHVRSRFNAPPMARDQLCVIQGCDLVVYPCAEPEIVRNVAVEEVLWQHPRGGARAGFLAVLEDGDCGYVPKDAVKPA